MAQDIRLFKYRKGATVIIQGTPNPGYFFIVKSGKLYVHSDHKLDDIQISIFDPGETLGLVSGLTGTEFLGTIIAERDSVVIRVPVSALGRYLRQHRDVCIKMIRSYSAELRALDRSLTPHAPGNQWDGRPEKLVMNAEHYLTSGQTEKAKYALAKFLEWGAGRSGSMSESFILQAREQLKKIDPSYRLPQRADKNISLKAGEILFLEDEPNDYFYVIKSGKISISRLVQNDELLLAILQPGEIFGEMALLEDQTRLASATAYSDAEVLRLTARTFSEDLGEKILQKIFESIARRIWFGHRRVAVMAEQDPVIRIYLYLLLLIERDCIFLKVPNKNDIVLPFGLSELKQMVGMANLPDSSIEPFLKDPNVEHKEEQITIFRSSNLESKLLQLQKRQKKPTGMSNL